MTPLGLDNDDESGQKEPSELKALKKALGDRFRELDTFLNKRIVPSLTGLTEDVGGRLESLEQTNAELARNIKKEQQNRFTKMRDDILKENQMMMERTVQMQTDMQVEMKEQKKAMKSLKREVNN